jgi:RNA polymerase sigma-70 factor (ECF subfamily)
MFVAVMKDSGIVFEQHRPRLLRLAHHMLGSSGDAEDVVQDAFLRWHQADTSEIRSPAGWLVTVVTRLALDRLRAAQTERKTYHGSWLPEPWVHGAQTAPGPDVDAERERALEYAALVLLERLGPDERAAFLLREVFGVEYAAIAEALSRSADACRQIVHRARARVSDDRQRRNASAVEKAELLERLRAASLAEDSSAIAALFVPNATFIADGGGKVFAARDALHGAERIAQVLTAITRKAVPRVKYEVSYIGEEPALIGWFDRAPVSVSMIDADGSGIHYLYRVLNPEKLARIPRPAS